MSKANPTGTKAASPANFALERGYLRFASPDRVYEYLRERSAPDWRDAWARHTVPRETLQMLHARREPLIDLAIARFGNDRDLSRELWASGDSDIRCALLANFAARAPSRGLGGLVDAEMVEHVLLHGTEDEASALLANPSTDPEVLGAVFARRGFGIEGLEDDRWVHLLYAAARNPSLTVDDWDDGWRAYQYAKALAAAWLLLMNVPIERRWASISRVILEWLPFPDWLPTEWEAASTGQPRDEFIEQVLKRWRTDEPSDYSSNEFGHLRRLIAFKATLESADDLRGSEDPFVREGFYAAFRPDDADELRRLCEEDGIVALRGLTDNVRLCGRQDLRETLAELCRRGTGDTERELLEMSLRWSTLAAGVADEELPDEEHRSAQLIRAEVGRSAELVRAEVRGWVDNLRSTVVSEAIAIRWWLVGVILMLGLLFLRVW